MGLQSYSATSSPIALIGRAIMRAIGIISCAVLAGCMALQNTGSQSDTTQRIERDVEAPDLLELTEEAIWDGSTSLGGIWVSRLQRTDPMKVIIRNTANDSFVIGSLLPGVSRPNGFALQVSQDAANALGMSEGVPSELKVTALIPEDTLKPAQDILPPTQIDTIVTETLEPAPKAPRPSYAPNVVSSLAKPYLQLGIFAVEDNADRAKALLRKAKLPYRVPTFTRDGKTYWRVVVGPATSEAQAVELTDIVKQEGFKDAYRVTN